MTLTDSRPYTWLEIIEAPQELQIHGFLPGEKIQIIANPFFMPVRVLLRGQKIAIRKSIAKKITVKKIEGQ